MVFTGVPLPEVKHGWIAYFVGIALGLSVLIFSIKSGNEDIFVSAYNFVFWIFFSLFWGAIGFITVQWIISKIFSTHQ